MHGVDVTTKRINKLPESLVNQIAAGEVIERPASVVKELLENSLDAGATKITVDITRGGSQLIRVVDNGTGIHAEDLGLVFDHHATSKISNREDLERIISLGFRGEALSSIAAVSRCKLISRERNNEHGYVAAVEHKNCSPQVSPAAHPVGTTIEVKELFFNTPGRKKFLRSEKTEFLHIQELVRRIALSRFGTSIQFNHNDRVVFKCNNNEQAPEQRIAQFFGQAFLNKAIPLDVQHDGYRLWGWIWPASEARSYTDRQYFFLNGRIIKDKQVNHAVRMAYKDQLYPGRYPAYVLYFEIDATAVDINVHPTKYEARFRDARDVHDFIQACLMNSLQHQVTIYNDDKLQTTESSQKYYSRLNIQQIRNTGKNYTVYNQLKNQKTFSPDPVSIMQGRFILLQENNQIILIDAYQARILILSQRLNAALEKDGIKSRPLLVPLNISVNEPDIKILLEYAELLQTLGIVVDQLAADVLLVREIPVLLADADITAMIRNIIDYIKINKKDINATNLIESLLLNANDSMGKVMSVAEMNQLIYDLRKIENKISTHTYHKAVQYINQTMLENLFKS